MATPYVRTSGALSTDGVVANGTGLLTHAEAVGGTLTLYEGNSTGSTAALVATIVSSASRDWAIPLKYNGGLYATISAGTAHVIHATNAAKTT
jgi:hypothetical protein